MDIDNVVYKYIEVDELAKVLNPSEPLMCDCETIGLYGKIRLAQFYQKGWDEVLIVEYPKPLELVSLLTKMVCVMHNSHYDISCIQDNIGKLAWMPEEFHDTFLLARLYYYTKESFGLDKVIEYAVGRDIYSQYDIDKAEMHKADWSVPVLPEKQVLYAAIDVVALHEVWDIVKESLEDYSYKLDLITTRNCLDFQNNGMPVDEDKLNDRFAKNMKRINEIGLPINCNSYQQVRKYIDSNKSDDLGLSTLIAEGNEKAAHVKETRKLTKQNSFLTKFANSMIDGKIFGKFKCSPRSGRTSSDDQNLQQLPRSLKGIFGVAVDGDEVLVYSDFAQIQLRGVCVVTGDKTMEKLFRAGEDLHNFVAEMIFGKDFTKRDRQISKTANFGLLFGAGILVFISILIKQAGLMLTEREAGAISKKWKGLWTQITEWQEKGIKDWRNKRVWQTPLGRRYVAKMMTDQLAMQIQGFEAEVAKLAMHYMLPKMKQLDERIRLCNFIHDSYIFIAPNKPEVYKEMAVIIADSMQEAWEQMCQSVKITDLPMPVNVRVGWNWGDIENDIFIYEYKQ